MRKRVITALMLAAIMLATTVSAAAQTIPQSGTATIVPNRLTVTWEDDDQRVDVTIDTFRFFGFNVAQLRTMVGVLDGTVSNLADGTFQIRQEGAPVNFQPVVFNQATEIEYIINTTPIRNNAGARFNPGQPGWVFLPEFEYNWASVRDVINAMDLDLVDVIDDPASGHTQVVVRRPGPPARPPSGPAVPPPGSRPGDGGWWRDVQNITTPAGVAVRYARIAAEDVRRMANDYRHWYQPNNNTTGSALGLQTAIGIVQNQIDNARRQVIDLALDDPWRPELLNTLESAQNDVNVARYYLTHYVLNRYAGVAINDLWTSTTTGAALEAKITRVHEIVVRTGDLVNDLPPTYWRFESGPGTIQWPAMRAELVTQSNRFRDNFVRLVAGEDYGVNGLAYRAMVAARDLHPDGTGLGPHRTHARNMLGLARTARDLLPTGDLRNEVNAVIYTIYRELGYIS
jgi:hypothetical protein